MDLKYPVTIEELEKSQFEIVKDYNEMQISIINDFLNEVNLSVQDILKPELSGDKEVQTICPRCHSEYIISEGFCSDCQNINLLPINKISERINE